ncbi:MAG TPA: hypothetical protein EYP98_06235, partial [Planctomycetes bacterium]|nr:hypothetical protein [Planctomycetota bacterium]
MRVLVVGGGGREHALVWRLRQSPSVTELHAAPGSAAMAQLAKIHDVAADAVQEQVAEHESSPESGYQCPGTDLDTLRF